MNTKINRRLGASLICVGVGSYLLALEFTRLMNFFLAQLTAFTMMIYLLSCGLCSVVIVVGLILAVNLAPRMGNIGTWILGIVVFFPLSITLVYCAYLIPFTQNRSLTVNDWLLISVICLAGILLLVWGWFDVAKRKKL